MSEWERGDCRALAEVCALLIAVLVFLNDIQRVCDIETALLTLEVDFKTGQEFCYLRLKK